MNTKHFARPDGTFLGSYGGTLPTDEDAAPFKAFDLIDVSDTPPEYGDQVWLFPGWGQSPGASRIRELEWQSGEMAIIANQLLAVEEEAGDVLPGTRKEWLSYRTQVRLWHESPDFPDSIKRPSRPA